MGNPRDRRADLQVKFRDTETLRNRLFASYVVQPDRLPTDLLEVALAGMNLPETTVTNPAIPRAAATSQNWRPEMRLDDTLAALKCPRSSCGAQTGHWLPADLARDPTKPMNNAKLIVIQDAGDIPQLDRADAVAEAVNGFLREPKRNPNDRRSP